MGAHALLSFVAFVVSGFTFTYVFAQHRRSPVNRAFLLLAGWFAAWMLVSFLLSTGVEGISKIQLRTVHSVAWAPVGFLAINFTYALLERPRDLIYCLSLSIAAVLLSVLTGLGAVAIIREVRGSATGSESLILHPLRPRQECCSRLSIAGSPCATRAARARILLPAASFRSCCSRSS